MTIYRWLDKTLPVWAKILLIVVVVSGLTGAASYYVFTHVAPAHRLEVLILFWLIAIFWRLETIYTRLK